MSVSERRVRSGDDGALQVAMSPSKLLVNGEGDSGQRSGREGQVGRARRRLDWGAARMTDSL